MQYLSIRYTERLAEAGVDGPFDAVFAAYLFRNVTDPDAVLSAVRDVLAPRGRLAVHEYTLSGRPLDRAVWTGVCRGLVVPVATVLGDGGLYRHLWRSVVEFDTADDFAARVGSHGFEAVRALPLPGWQTVKPRLARWPGVLPPPSTSASRPARCPTSPLP